MPYIRVSEGLAIILLRVNRTITFLFYKKNLNTQKRTSNIQLFERTLPIQLLGKNTLLGKNIRARS